MTEAPRTPPEEGTSDAEVPRSAGDAFRIALPNFEGPLDLLLHLIREHRVDIFDIPIALIVEKYLGYLERMRELNLDIAGEFLVMASTLAHLKSRMLLPRQDAAATVEAAEAAAEEAGDPRAEQVRAQGQVSFEKLFTETSSRQEIVITFLAILEMVKRRLIRVSQEEPLKDIILTPNGDALERLVPTEVDESDYR